jgi:phosphoglycerate dehydrogenase-like enzyme
MKLLIFVRHPSDLWNAPAWFAEQLRSEFPQVDVVQLSDCERVDAEILDAEIAITWSIRPEQIKAAQKLRWIHSPAAAIHQLIFPELVESDIILTNARDVHCSCSLQATSCWLCVRNTSDRPRGCSVPDKYVQPTQ